MKRYYDKPTQVMYYLISVEGEEGQYVSGIAYCDEVISARHGTIILIDEIIQMAAADGISEEKAIDELYWVDFSTEIEDKQRTFEKIADSWANLPN